MKGWDGVVDIRITIVTTDIVRIFIFIFFDRILVNICWAERTTLGFRMSTRKQVCAVASTCIRVVVFTFINRELFIRVKADFVEGKARSIQNVGSGGGGSGDDGDGHIIVIVCYFGGDQGWRGLKNDVHFEGSRGRGLRNKNIFFKSGSLDQGISDS